MTDVLKACATCGRPSNRTYCPEHRRKQPSATRRGYGYQHQKRRRIALQQQNWCTDCGRDDIPMHLEHHPSAWEREAQGLPIRYGIDIEITCGPCNYARGPARTSEQDAKPLVRPYAADTLRYESICNR